MMHMPHLLSALGFVLVLHSLDLGCSYVLIYRKVLVAFKGMVIKLQSLMPAKHANRRKMYLQVTVTSDIHFSICVHLKCVLIIYECAKYMSLLHGEIKWNIVYISFFGDGLNILTVTV